MSGRVSILLASYQGAAHLPAQLDSFAAQTHADWDLIASDDGSTDATRAILQDFAGRMGSAGRTVTLRDGPRRGATANFLSLLAEAPDTPWVALSDQDDVWLPDRLARGIAALSALPAERPALYCSATLVTDAALTGAKPSRAVPRRPGFRNALLQNIASGNTTLVNRAAADLARIAAPAALAVPDLPAHDWWLYQMVSGAGGTVIYDAAPTLYYRQHARNEIGANHGLRAGGTRLAMLMGGRFRRWTDANIAALGPVADHLTPENRALLKDFAALRTRTLPARLAGFARLRLYRQSRPAQAAMWLALALGRL